jgi:hypothetical protein
MGLCVALPLVPWPARSWAARGHARAWGLALVGALLACAVPPPFAGWAPVAGLAVVVAAVGLAHARPTEAS